MKSMLAHIDLTLGFRDFCRGASGPSVANRS